MGPRGRLQGLAHVSGGLVELGHPGERGELEVVAPPGEGALGDAPQPEAREHGGRRAHHGCEAREHAHGRERGARGDAQHGHVGEQLAQPLALRRRPLRLAALALLGPPVELRAQPPLGGAHRGEPRRVRLRLAQLRVWLGLGLGLGLGSGA